MQHTYSFCLVKDGMYGRYRIIYPDFQSINYTKNHMNVVLRLQKNDFFLLYATVYVHKMYCLRQHRPVVLA